MPTKRSRTTASCTKSSLIVAGGEGVKGMFTIGLLSTVEVMNTTTHQWFAVADLPEPALCMSSAAVCGDRLYLLGGKNGSYNPSMKGYTCLLSALLQSTKAEPSLGAQCKKILSLASLEETVDIVWSK